MIGPVSRAALKRGSPRPIPEARSAATPDDLRASGSITAGLKQDLTPADINAMRRLTPGASLPFLRSLIEYEVKPALQEAVK